MRYAFFLGCTIPARARNYEMSAVEVAKALGIELLYFGDFSCCGFPLKSYNTEVAGTIAARNIAIAEENNLDIVTLCSACYSMLNEEKYHLKSDVEYLDKINQSLSCINKTVRAEIQIKHFARLLLEPQNLDKLIKGIKVDLKKLPVAIHYGCHYLKPSYVFDDFENPEEPLSIHKVIENIGATVLDYKGEKDCCGGAVLAFDENTATNLAKNKLINVKDAGAKAMVVVCPFCSVMYDDGQKAVEKKFEIEIGIPVLFLPQLVGLSLGIDPKALGMNLNTVKTKNLLEEVLGS